MKDRWNRKSLALLSLLRSRSAPVSSPELMQLLHADNFELSERSVRNYLDDLCASALVERTGKKGYRLTKKGHSELSARTITEKVGFLSSRINSLAYQMRFDPDRMEGTVVLNVSFVDPNRIRELLPMFKRVFERGLAMGSRILLLAPGEGLGELTVPAGMIGIGTVCSVTINGVLLKAGVPVDSRFGGILAIEDGRPVGFVDVIMYNGTSMDPLEIFIRSGMTDYLGAIRTGRGRVGASFREFPAETMDIVKEVTRKLRKAELGGFELIGAPGRPLLQIPVNDGCVGAVIMGGLNPVAVFEESGVRVNSRALSGIVDYKRLFPVAEIDQRLEALVG